MTALALVLLGFLLLMVFGQRVMRRLFLAAACLLVAWFVFLGISAWNMSRPNRQPRERSGSSIVSVDSLLPAQKRFMSYDEYMRRTAPMGR